MTIPQLQWRTGVSLFTGMSNNCNEKLTGQKSFENSVLKNSISKIIQKNSKKASKISRKNIPNTPFFMKKYHKIYL